MNIQKAKETWQALISFHNFKSGDQVLVIDLFSPFTLIKSHKNQSYVLIDKIYFFNLRITLLVCTVYKLQKAILHFTFQTANVTMIRDITLLNSKLQ